MSGTGSIGFANVSLHGSISAIASLSGTISEAVVKPPAHSPYTGQYEITPSTAGEQVLQTKDKYMTDNLVVHEIPYSEVSNTAEGITVYIGKEVLTNG